MDRHRPRPRILTLLHAVTKRCVGRLRAVVWGKRPLTAFALAGYSARVNLTSLPQPRARSLASRG